ncbi:MAG TPA: ABC transporter permease [Chroococcales cyanobacterium]
MTQPVSAALSDETTLEAESLDSAAAGTADAIASASGMSPAEQAEQLDWQYERANKSEGIFALIPYTIGCVAELRNVKFALASFVVNNLRRRYRRSVLGFAWSLLNPLLTMTVMTAVFSLLWHADPRQFGVYVFTGLLPWTFITDSITNGSLALVQSEAFLKKVYIPKAFFPLVYVSTEAANFVFSLVSLVILATLVGLQLHWTLLLVPFATALLFLFNFSVTLFLAISTVYFRDLSHIIKVGLSTLFYTVPIVYKLEMVPQEYRALFLLNPIYYFVQLFRDLILDGRMPGVMEWSIPSLIALGFAALAFYTLMRTERDLIYRL